MVHMNIPYGISMMLNSEKRVLLHKHTRMAVGTGQPGFREGPELNERLKPPHR